MGISSKRFQTGVFEAVAASNRFAGSGGGSGLNPFASLGIAAVFVNTGGLTATSYTAMPGTVSFTFTTPRTAPALFFFFATCYITAGAGQIRVRTNLVGQAQSGPLKFAGTGAAALSNGFGHLYIATLQPGTYTVQNEYQVDAGTTGFIDQSYVQGFQLGF